MIATEWAEKYGIESARKAFGLTDHVVFEIRNGYVVARCGKWIASNPGAPDTAIPALLAALPITPTTTETIGGPENG